MKVLGIDDPAVWSAYLLCILSVVYGMKNWNKGEEEARPEDVKWVQGEKEVEDQL